MGSILSMQWPIQETPRRPRQVPSVFHVLAGVVHQARGRLSVMRDRDALLLRARDVLASEPRAVVDYVELRREGDLEPLPGGPVDGGRLLVAARFSRGSRPVRLLDNMSLSEGATS